MPDSSFKIGSYRSKEIGSLVGCREMSVNNRINRFEKEGMDGLLAKRGRVCKPILSADELSMVRAAVQIERQRLLQTHLLVEAGSGKSMSKKTLSHFLKFITAVTEE